MNKRYIFIIMVISLVLLIKLSSETSKDLWSCFIYPDRNLLNHSIEVGKYPSLDSCREAAYSALKYYHREHCMGLDCDDDPMKIGDYECGLNCEYNEKYSAQTCSESRQ